MNFQIFAANFFTTQSQKHAILDNKSLYKEYEESRDNGNEDLNFHNYINKTESCIACLKENGMKRFTFSSGWTEAIGNAWELQKAGCRMVGMKEVKGKPDSWSGKQEILPALVFEIN